MNPLDAILVGAFVWPKGHVPVKTRLSIDPEIKLLYESVRRRSNLKLAASDFIAVMQFYQHVVKKAEGLHPHLTLVRCIFEENPVGGRLQMHANVTVTFPFKNETERKFETYLNLRSFEPGGEQVVEEKDLLEKAEESAKELVADIVGSLKQAQPRLQSAIHELQDFNKFCDKKK